MTTMVERLPSVRAETLLLRRTHLGLLIPRGRPGLRGRLTHLGRLAEGLLQSPCQT